VTKKKGDKILYAGSDHQMDHAKCSKEGGKTGG